MIKCVFKSGYYSLVQKTKKDSNDDIFDRKIAASNKTFTFGFKQNYETT